MKLQTGMAETFASSETAADTQRRFLRSCANTWPLNDGYGRFWHTDLSPKSDPKMG
jgi:hypothetical protein